MFWKIKPNSLKTYLLMLKRVAEIWTLIFIDARLFLNSLNPRILDLKEEVMEAVEVVMVAAEEVDMEVEAAGAMEAVEDLVDMEVEGEEAMEAVVAVDTEVEGVQAIENAV